MESNRRRITVEEVIIGTGPSALAAARTSVKHGIPTDQILMIDSAPYVGGSCRTYYPSADSKQPNTEYGAEFVSYHYDPDIYAAMWEKRVKLSKVDPTRTDSLSIFRYFNSLSLGQKVMMGAKFAVQFASCQWDIQQYQQLKARNAPELRQYEEPFGDYINRNGRELIGMTVAPVLVNFGYGLYSEITTAQAFEYMNHILTDMLTKQVSVVSDGFQYFMERMAEDFRVELSAKITHVERNDNGVVVTYQNSHGVTVDCVAKTLIVSAPPKQWENIFGKGITTTEQQSHDKATDQPYAVVICTLTGAKPQMVFEPNAETLAGKYHVALVTVKQKAAINNKLLATAYLMLPPGLTADDMQHPEFRAQLIKEIQHLTGATHVEINDSKLWSYSVTLPFDTRRQLENEQGKNSTLYVGGYTWGRFWDVHSAYQSGRDTVALYKFKTQPPAPTASMGNWLRYFALHHFRNKSPKYDAKAQILGDSDLTRHVNSFAHGRGLVTKDSVLAELKDTPLQGSTAKVLSMAPAIANASLGCPFSNAGVMPLYLARLMSHKPYDSQLYDAKGHFDEARFNSFIQHFGVRENGEVRIYYPSMMQYLKFCHDIAYAETAPELEKLAMMEFGKFMMQKLKHAFDAKWMTAANRAEWQAVYNLFPRRSANPFLTAGEIKQFLTDPAGFMNYVKYNSMTPPKTNALVPVVAAKPPATTSSATKKEPKETTTVRVGTVGNQHTSRIFYRCAHTAAAAHSAAPRLITSAKTLVRKMTP